MAQTKKLGQECWQEYLGMFSSGNRGRMITIELADISVGNQSLVDLVPLLAIDYDPENKGDDLVITTGMDAVEYTHRISAPGEIWEFQDDNGKVTALEIIERKGAKTIVTFKS